MEESNMIKKSKIKGQAQSWKVCSRREFVRMGAMFAATAFPLLGCSIGSKDDNPPDTGGAALAKVSFAITFSKAMDTASVEQGMTIAPGNNTQLSNVYAWSENDTVLNYITDVDEKREYTVTIAGTAKDKTGKLLDGNSDGTGGDEYAFEVMGV